MAIAGGKWYPVVWSYTPRCYDSGWAVVHIALLHLNATISELWYTATKQKWQRISTDDCQLCGVEPQTGLGLVASLRQTDYPSFKLWRKTCVQSPLASRRWSACAACTCSGGVREENLLLNIIRKPLRYWAGGQRQIERSSGACKLEGACPQSKLD